MTPQFPCYLKPGALFQVLHDVLLDVERAERLQGPGSTRRVPDGRVALERRQVLAAGDHRVGDAEVVVDVTHLVEAGRRQEDDERHELGAVPEDLERLRRRVQDARLALVDDGPHGVEFGAVQVAVVFAVFKELVVLDAPLHVLAIDEPVPDTIVLLC